MYTFERKILQPVGFIKDQAKVHITQGVHMEKSVMYLIIITVFACFFF